MSKAKSKSKSHLSTYLAAGVVGLAGATLAGAQQAQAAQTAEVTYQSGATTVWDNPSTGQQPTRYLTKGQSVKIQATKQVYGEKWYQIGNDEWVPAKYFKAAATEKVAAKTSDTVTGNYKDGAITIWTSPTSGQASGQYMVYGQTKTTTNKVQVGNITWYQIGTNAWVPSAYVAYNNTSLAGLTPVASTNLQATSTAATTPVSAASTATSTDTASANAASTAAAKSAATASANAASAAAASVAQVKVAQQTAAQSAATASANAASQAAAKSAATASANAASAAAAQAAAQSAATASANAASTAAAKSAATASANAANQSAATASANAASTAAAQSAATASANAASAAAAKSAATASANAASTAAAKSAATASANAATASQATVQQTSTAATSQASTSNTAASSAQTTTANTSSSTSSSASTSTSYGTGAQAAISAAESQIGVAYVWGGETAGVGFDCSGLTQWALAKAGVSIGRVTTAQESAGTKVSISQLQAGDLVFWGSAGATYHVALYIGNNQYVNAPEPGETVKIATISSYFEPSFGVHINY
ncbi:C40 family peptidase [Loigolactobacillus binensis]|uniref:C40 family peptidase n=1 Tax=Loigolactobacillus binensis TaxID=2559922 RepID=A0ABW3E9W0_9LACO|nr:C40 family peptidase [Loigolactobacillus binensis]